MKIKTLKGLNCLITGAASGIGRATALAAAEEGACLFLTDINAQALDQVVSEISASGGHVVLAQAIDIADHAAVAGMAKVVESLHGSMDVVMNIAGISVWGAIDKLQHQHWRRCIEVNLMGPIHVLECFVPAMINAGRGGHIVNVSSAAGLFGLPWHAAYSASKFGLRGISEVLRFDLEQHHIGVSLVCPGGVDTGLVRTVDIVGVNRQDPEIQTLTHRFQRHAVAPEAAARAILKGIKRGRYLVFTSPDIAIGYWFQCKMPWSYEIAMRLMNRYLSAALRRVAGAAHGEKSLRG